VVGLASLGWIEPDQCRAETKDETGEAILLTRHRQDAIAGFGNIHS
jgi:hypothetical protein